jgi:hypothetical protein
MGRTSNHNQKMIRVIRNKGNGKGKKQNTKTFSLCRCIVDMSSIITGHRHRKLQGKAQKKSCKAKAPDDRQIISQRKPLQI